MLRVPGWSLRVGERWVLEGVNGSGKSALLRLLAGIDWPHAPDRGHERRRYHFDGVAGWTPLPALRRVALLNADLQNRYLVQDWALTAAEVVATGFENTSLLHRRPSREQLADLRRLLKRMGLEELADRPFLDLSQGERRKVLIARALVRKPEVLLLDEFLEGLDPAAQERFAGMLDHDALQGTSVVLTTHRPLRSHLAGWRRLCIHEGEAREMRERISISSINLVRGERELLRGWRPATSIRAGDSQALLAIREGKLFVGERCLLEDLQWALTPGEHWVLLGANGSGKTSLLRLLWGDLHLALGGEIRRFGRDDLTVHQIRKRSGFFLPDFHGTFPSHQTGLEAILSGFFASIGLMDAPSDAQRESARELAGQLQVSDLLDRPLGEMSYGQARRILLARALVHGPDILLLDEPFDGLDGPSRQRVADLLQRAVVAKGVTVVLSSHHAEDIPPWVRRAAWTKGGRLRFFERSHL